MARLIYVPDKSFVNSDNSECTSLFSCIRKHGIRRRNQYFIESNISTDFKLFEEVDSNDVIIYENDEMIAKVNSVEIILNGTSIQFFKGNWKVSGQWRMLRKTLMTLNDSNEYKLNNGAIATVEKTMPIDLFTFIYRKILGKKIEVIEESYQIDFDETTFDPLLAFCILAVQISEKYSRDDMS